uniref:LIM zinc-binding domain-containing protein n=1 Tax=Heterorhabditis bacteriophora TaxID=37862 RepID=A0A1I7XA61_HETBA
MARAAGHDLHGDCLSCATCGNSLRNVGHHFIDVSQQFILTLHVLCSQCPVHCPLFNVHSSSESRVPLSVRPAVSPRRSGRMPRQWPPPKGLPINRYWQIDPIKQYDDKNKRESLSLSDMIIESEKEQQKRKKKERKDDTKQILVLAKNRTNIIYESEPLQSISAQEEPYLKQEDSRKTPEITISDDSPKIFENFTSPLPQEPTLSHAVSGSNIYRLSQAIDMSLPTSNIENQCLDQSKEPLTAQDTVSSKPQPNSISLSVPSTTDSSTSPIPIIRLTRRKSDGSSELCTRSHISPPPLTSRQSDTLSQLVPETTSISLPLHCNSALIESPVYSPFHEQSHSLIKPNVDVTEETENHIGDTNISSTLYNHQCQTKRLKKPLRRVDFSKATIIPDNGLWTNDSNIVDEIDILTQTSQRSESPLPHFDNMVSDFVKVSAPYDGDESELYDNKSDAPSTLNTDIEDEQESWMKEELELANKEELAMQNIEIMKTEVMEGDERWSPLMKNASEKEEWRKHAMELLNDEAQNEKDLAIVAALNKRLQGLRELEDDDRQKAIECIEQHQRNLEEQQEQLSTLLDSAIIFLKNFDAQAKNEVSTQSNNTGEVKIKSSSLVTNDRELATEGSRLETVLSIWNRIYPTVNMTIADWNALFTTKCVNCRFPIEAGDRWVEALGSAFHSNCFNCTRCHANLEGESFFAKNGQPFCKMHA